VEFCVGIHRQKLPPQNEMRCSSKRRTAPHQYLID
jgi:hypothetical protein